MAYVGRRVEVLWPPEGDDTEGSWYSGLLDGYEDGTHDGNVYHVTYDDGDEEVLGEEEIDSGGNVRLVADTEDRQHDTNPSEEGDAFCEEVGAGEKAATDGAEREQRGGSDKGMSQAPTGNDSAEMSYREIERPTSPRDGTPSSSSSGDLSGEGDAQGFRTRDLFSKDRSFSADDDGGVAAHGLHAGNGSGGRRTIEAREKDPQAESSPSVRRGERRRPSLYSPEVSAEDLQIANVTDSNTVFDDEEDDDDTLFGAGGGGIGVRGSYREEADPDGEGGYDDGGEGTAYDDDDQDEGEESFVEDYFLLSGNSSDWTPLKGADLVASSPPASRQQLRSRGCFVGSSAENGEERHGSNGSAAAAATTTSTTEACLVALRNAVNATTTAPSPGGTGAFDPSGRLRSATLRRGQSGARKGRDYDDDLVVDGINGGCGEQKEDEGLAALGAFVNDTALLAGAVEGVEESEGRRLQAMGGVFVKVSFMDGGGAGGGPTSTTTNAMFRCKTVVHTTGSAPAPSAGDGGINAGWPNGEFQCETFHGGRLGELSSAAVLFSVHRRRDCSARAGGLTRSSGRDGFLGQVVLPLHSLVHNLRPVVEPVNASSSPGANACEEESKRGPPTAPDLADHGNNKNKNNNNNSNNNSGKGNGGSNGKSCWRSLRGETIGVFPMADRRGKTSVENGSSLHLRLRLSVTLGVNSARLDDPAKGENFTPLQPVGGAADVTPVAAVAPYASVGGGVALENGAPRQCRVVSAVEGRGRGQGGGGKGRKEWRTRRNRIKAPADPSSIPKVRCLSQRTDIRCNNGGRGGMKGAGKRWKYKPLTAAAASENHGAALARQRLKEQEKIAQENEIMERRLKAIREAPPASVAPHSYRRADMASAPGGRHGSGGSGGKDAAAVKRRKGRTPATVSTDDSSDHGSDSDVVHNGAAAGRRESTAWRELYHEREALASAVEAAAAEAASARARVEALRAKTLWTEANARSASLAVASLGRLLDPRGTGGQSRQGEKAASVAPAPGSAAASLPGGAFVPVESDLDGSVDEGLAAELRRQEELHQALVETRRTVVTVGEVARLAQEADLTELDGLRIQLEQAEKRQARHQWRRQHERTETAAAARRKHLRGGHSSVSGGVDGGGGGGGVGGAAESGAEDRGDARYNGNGLGLPKDALERAQDLAMSLRVEVETLRLANALEASTQGVGVEAENGGVGKEGATAATVASGVRESCHAQEEVDSLKAQLEAKTKRLEVATFDRDAIRAEFQHAVGVGQRSALKESTGWLEHAALYLSKT